MTQPITGSNGSTSMVGELAALLIQVETNQSESSRLQRDAARESYLENAERQVEALHAAAAATRTGAYLGAAFTVASAGFSIAAASWQSELLGTAAKASGELSGLAKSIVGDSVAADFQASAKRFETLAEQAKWQAGDASTSADKADRLEDKVLDLLQGIQSDANSSANAILGRM